VKTLIIGTQHLTDKGKPRKNGSGSPLFVASLLVFGLAGCSDSTKTTGGGPNPIVVQKYLAAGAGNLQSYVIDSAAKTFVVSSYASSGGSIQSSGSISQNANGVFDLNTTYLPGYTISGPPLTGNWLVSLTEQAVLSELETTDATGTSYTSFAPLVPVSTCPVLSKAGDFQFVTVPKKLSSGSKPVSTGWNPQIETAYGSVSISTNGNSVQFSNISQHTFPASNGGTSGTLINPATSPSSGACSSTFFGQTISVPSSSTVVNPGSGQTISPTATIGIGPSGFLVEDAGLLQGTTNSSVPPYDNVLGAGYGAIGLPKPSSALATSDVVAAQYQGILYGAASGSRAAVSDPGFRLIGSFGYPNLQTSCPTLPAPTTSTIIYGGEFASNDPSSNAFGNCDLAIDLGGQDSTNNGLYPAVTVYISGAFPFNSRQSAYSFPAVAIAGQINGKYAIFLIGVDTAGLPAQPWGIYLLQSN
jgi:hypothetical protein